MLFYIVAIFLFIGSWYYYSWNRKKRKGLLPFSLIILGAPIIYHMVGLNYAAFIHSQGGALTSSFLAILLLANNLIILMISIYYIIRKK